MVSSLSRPMVSNLSRSMVRIRVPRQWQKAAAVSRRPHSSQASHSSHTTTTTQQSNTIKNPLASLRTIQQHAREPPLHFPAAGGRSSTVTHSATTAPAYQLDSEALVVQFDKGRSSKFDHIWLRDNCRCEECFHPHTKQRLLGTFEIPLNIQPTRVVTEAEGLSLTWPDGHESFMEFSFLLQNSYDPPLSPATTCTNSTPVSTKKYLWDNSIINCMPRVTYKDIFSTDELTWKGDFYVLEWLRKIDKYGFCLVDDVPPTPEATEKLLKRIAFIRETHYGAFWDFTANMEHGDTAYTNLALGAHTDTTYFSDPAGLQLFHLLSPAGSHEGGKSLLVDGFAAAAKLMGESPWAYKVLSEVPIETHASGGADVAFRPLIPQPVFSHHPLDGQLAMVRWNPDDRLPFNARAGPPVKLLYRAIREWETILKSHPMELWTQMKMGQALIFDNHRVLHGRSSFTGSRRLCGGYVNGDDYRCRLRSLEQRLLDSSAPPVQISHLHP